MGEKGNFKKRLWISLGIIISTLTLGSVGLYLLSGELSAQSTEIVNDKNLIAEQATIVSTLAGLKSDAVKSIPYLAAMRKLMPTHDELIGFSPWLNSLAKSHDVTVSFAFTGTNSPATDSVPGNDSFSMTAIGDSSDVVAFLKDLETTAQGFLLAVDSFDFSVVGGPTYQISIQGRLFSR